MQPNTVVSRSHVKRLLAAPTRLDAACPLRSLSPSPPVKTEGGRRALYGVHRTLYARTYRAKLARSRPAAPMFAGGGMAGVAPGGQGGLWDVLRKEVRWAFGVGACRASLAAA